MNDFEKHKLKEKLKTKKKWLIGTGLFLLAGVIAWVIGSFASGENPIKWLTSPFAITLYILVGIFLFFAVWFFCMYYVYKNK